MAAVSPIRPARVDELASILAIEDEAGRIYGQVGLPADLEGLSEAAVRAAHDEGLLWVVPSTDDAPIAFALCWRRPDALHLRELDVHPDHQRRGLGRVLIDFVADRARDDGRDWVTLTTFADVPWNAPLYRRYGFDIVEDATWPWLAEIRAEERREGLDRWPRVAMRRPA